MLLQFLGTRTLSISQWLHCKGESLPTQFPQQLRLLPSADVIVLGGGVEDMGLVVPNNDGYLGCIDRVVVNNEQLALLLPNERSPIVTVCGPRYAYTQYPPLRYTYMQLCIHAVAY